ncbi:Uma2 family endonuclease [Leptothrix discophora]|uniref:Uma2 family endonuclease n=1 Tax=Leptothrix discophora TaxID=89 RepID=A0ABT9G8I7_LEPDI|nr:Uma2 family endonuclease [Leptothrix discophora]MDP4302776.1 Uma2 family endonuclease [Leptothrix discophora]
MSAVLKPTPKMDLQAFLAWEEQQAERHEFVGGEVFAMTGARATHNTIALNMASSLKQGLRGTPCRTHIEGMKVHVQAVDSVLYPDVFVTCEPVDLTPEAETSKTAPRLVVEVLSPSTAAYDRGLKFELYQRLPSLQEYLLVEADRAHVDLFRRNAEGLWVLHPAGPGATIELASLGLSLTMDQVYEDVDFGVAGAATEAAAG